MPRFLILMKEAIMSLEKQMHMLKAQRRRGALKECTKWEDARMYNDLIK